MNQNPYTLVFGKEPSENISRAAQMVDILDSFTADPALQQIYMITSVRGSGKTVFMTEISKELAKRDDWIIVELNSSGDMLLDLAAALASEDTLARLFQNASINLSFFGIGLEVKNSVQITSIQVALSKMFESLKKKGKKVLICIDEVVSTEHMRSFAGAFQIFVRQELPVFLIMTGLFENINNIQNEKNLTFLYRAPKVELKPLNIRTIADNYKKAFSVDDTVALDMAKLTKGYSFAFQVLGYFTWKYDSDYEKALPDFRQYLEDYVYEKIWSEMSSADKKLAYGIANVPSGKASDIKKFLDIENNQYTPYRDRLIKRGLIDGSQYGYIRFTLPLFEDYVLFNYME
ncbi:MAG: ATP-binding protein [Lachnospiraceae bacterium]|nr:ATP-binding protein [Lachnospiraceae bacterium]